MENIYIFVAQDSFSFSTSTFPPFLLAVTVSCPSKISPLASHSQSCLWMEFDTGNTRSWTGDFMQVSVDVGVFFELVSVKVQAHRKMTDSEGSCGLDDWWPPFSGSRQPCYSSHSQATLCNCSPMDLCPWHQEAISLFICALSLFTRIQFL